MKQIIYLHGGTVFPDQNTFARVLQSRDYDPRQKNERRINRLAETLKTGYETFTPEMPNKYDASYRLRKIRFEKLFPYLNDEDLILIGHSLGGMFLIKYIGENGFPKRIKQLHLVSAVFDESDMDEDEKYSGDFAYSPDIIKNLEQYADQIFLYHSTDDDIVPYSHAQKIISYLPHAQLVTLHEKGHLF